MVLLSESLIELQKKLQILPGIGEKTAMRLAFFLVKQPKEKALSLANAISNALEKCKPCSNCFILSDTDPCAICTNPSRNNEQLCIVESSRDINLIENTNEFKGRYFVLGSLLSPINGIGPKEIRMNELNNFLQKHNIKEAIIAIPASTEGETTIHYIAEHFKHMNIKITRLSTGIPYGGDMEFTGITTIADALKRRYPV